LVCFLRDSPRDGKAVTCIWWMEDWRDLGPAAGIWGKEENGCRLASCDRNKQRDAASVRWREGKRDGACVRKMDSQPSVGLAMGDERISCWFALGGGGGEE
jgi:hypothetical protein